MQRSSTEPRLLCRNGRVGTGLHELGPYDGDDGRNDECERREFCENLNPREAAQELLADG